MGRVFGDGGFFYGQLTSPSLVPKSARSYLGWPRPAVFRPVRKRGSVGVDEHDGAEAEIMGPKRRRILNTIGRADTLRREVERPASKYMCRSRLETGPVSRRMGASLVVT